MKLCPAARTDSYKFGHFKQNRPGTIRISSYIEARGTDKPWTEMVFSGIQYYQKEYLSEPYFSSLEEIKYLEDRTKKHGLSFNTESAKHILNKHGGYLPFRIQALPEGMVVPLRTPLVQVVNTDDMAAPWVPYIETGLLRAIWYPTTVATLSFHCKRTIKEYMLSTAGHVEGIDFKLQDFGARGVSSSESAQIGGMGHLLNFKGSDTFEAIEMIAMHYGEDMAGFSIDAAEHSTVTSFGGPEYEREAYRHLISTLSGSNKPFAIVSDSYDLYSAITNIYGTDLKSQIEALKLINSTLVVRPDSGNPVLVVSDTIELLMSKFGYTLNQKGYKVLPNFIRVIQGDGINEVSIRLILEEMKRRGLSAENITFGMGGALLQGVNRDTLQFAMKSNEAINETFNNGQPYPIFKQPKTDSGKSSKKGRQAVVLGNEQYNVRVLPEAEWLAENNSTSYNLLEDVYLNGENVRLDTFANMRARVESAL
jgi:nicotinamide phosphoribosyltransferase